MATNEFVDQWNSLTVIQKEAASWDQGSILILAGPGSGKTRVLTSRIARLLNDSPNENFRILGLTFTNAAADEMRKRINKSVPGNEHRIFIGTFHSFCSEIIRQHGAHVGINPNFSIYSHEKDLLEILTLAIRRTNLNVQCSEKNVQNYLSSIQSLKSKLILPYNYIPRFGNDEKEQTLIKIYQEYENMLLEKNALDFNSLLMRTYELFVQYPHIAEHYRIVYKFVCVDEFQDTNQQQYEIIKLLTGEKTKNVFVVADDDQIIYQWNGANPKRIKSYVRDFSPKILQMPMNFRCPPPVVKIANNLIKKNLLRFQDRQPLESNKSEINIPSIQTFFDLEDNNEEFKAVVKNIKKYHSKNPDTVAVLARRRKILDDILVYFKEEDLSAVICKRKDDFESTPFIWITSVMQLFSDKENKKYLESLCGSFLQITNIDIQPDIVLNDAKLKGWNYLYSWMVHVEEINLKSNFFELLNNVNHLYNGKITHSIFAENVIEWFSNISNQHPTNLNSLEWFTGFDEEKIVWEKISQSIFETLGSASSIEAFLQEMQIHSKESTPDKDAIRLMTIHGAKGKEFSHVYLIGLVEGELPSFQSLQKGDDSPEMEEERRNCFVAITRTQSSLSLSYANKYYGFSKEPSRFLYDMKLL